MNQAIELIRQLVREGFYGALTLKFEAGRITVVKKEQTLKFTTPPEQPGKAKHDEHCNSTNNLDPRDSGSKAQGQISVEL